MMKTGLPLLDGTIGNLKGGTIIDIFGPSGSGKTQLVLQIAANVLKDGGTVLYQDTTGNFRPERLVEILKENGLGRELLDRVMVGRITNISEQVNAISKITPEVNLVIIDNVTDLFSFEYPKEEQILEKTNIFAKYMRSLSQKAQDTLTLVVVVNMVRHTDSTEQENMDAIISLFTHIKIRLGGAGYNEHTGMLILPTKTTSFSYRITRRGIAQSTEAI